MTAETKADCDGKNHNVNDVTTKEAEYKYKLVYINIVVVIFC